MLSLSRGLELVFDLSTAFLGISAQAVRLVTFVVLLATILGAVISLWRMRRRHTVLSTDLKTVVDERRRAVRALRETELLYYSLVETLPQNILRKDLNGRFTFANQRFCTGLGRSLDEILGKTDFDFYPRELAEKYRRDDRRVIYSGQALNTVEQHVTPKGESLYVEVMKMPLYDHDGMPFGIQVVFWDVTERIRTEEQLKEQNLVLQSLAQSEREAHQALKNAQSRLVETEKLASLGQLVAGVAHEINNPLSFVTNNVAVLDRDLRDLLALIALYREGENDFAYVRQDLIDKINDLDERIDLNYSLANLPRLIERTREGLRRIERIVKELRLFARVDEGDWNEVDLNPGIESSINMVKGYARKKGVQVTMELGAMPPVCCRAARIHQVVVNLLTNAIDACAEDVGLVNVRSQAEPEVSGVRIDIEDNGCGIEPSIRDRIFDPFFTTKPIGQGTGLGLSISYGIIQEHGGRIEVRSTPGKGSCFTVHLPVEPARRGDGDAVPLLKGLDSHTGGPPALSALRSERDASSQPVPVSPAPRSGELAP